MLYRLFSFLMCGWSLSFLTPVQSFACQGSERCNNINCATSLLAPGIQTQVVVGGESGRPQSLPEEEAPSCFSLALGGCWGSLRGLVNVLSGSQLSEYQPFFPAVLVGLIFDYVGIEDLKEMKDGFKATRAGEKSDHSIASAKFSKQFSERTRIIDIGRNWKSGDPSVGFSSFFAPYHFSTWFSIVPNLNVQILRVEHDAYFPGLKDLTAYFPNLIRVELIGPDQKSPKYQKDSARRVSVRWWNRMWFFPDEGGFNLPCLLLQLKDLRLCRLFLRDYELYFLFTSLPRLEMLDLSGNPLFTGDVGIEREHNRRFTLKDQKETLKSLNLIGTHLVRIDYIAFLSKLQFLDISYLDRDKDFFPKDSPMSIDLSRIKKLTRLESLNLSGHGLDSTKGGLAFVAKLSHLKTLAIAAMFLLVDEDLDSLEELTSLRELDVSENEHITIDRLKKLQQALPQLKIKSDFGVLPPLLPPSLEAEESKEQKN